MRLACLIRNEEASLKREQETKREETVCSATKKSQKQEEEETEILSEKPLNPCS